jgi:hypothetical protein
MVSGQGQTVERPQETPDTWFDDAFQRGRFIKHQKSGLCFFVIEDDTQTKGNAIGGFGYGYATRSLALTRVQTTFCNGQ